MKSELKILLVEDDLLFIEAIMEDISDSFPEAKISVITQEAGFAAAFDEWVTSNEHSLIILDVMVQWWEPKREQTEPSRPLEVVEEGYHNAGIRCLRIIRENPRAKEIPVVVHSNLGKEDCIEKLSKIGAVPDGRRLVVVPKSGQADLVNTIRHMVQAV